VTTLRVELARILWTCFGLGMVPFAPGTFGTLGGVALGFLLPGPLWLLGAVAVLMAVGVPLARLAERVAGRADPGSFVLDEVAGYLVALLWLPAGHDRGLILLLAFLAFRLFDIAKPPPVRRLERLPGGWGVMVDDLAAGAYANLLLQVFLRLV
jgi:phosphatidylglycerophosphatase A